MIEFEIICGTALDTLSAITLPYSCLHILRDVSSDSLLESDVNVTMIRLDTSINVGGNQFRIMNMESLGRSCRLPNQIERCLAYLCGIHA